MVCCIKKFPLSPVESCAATAADMLEAFNRLKMVGAEGGGDEDADEDDDFANNVGLPEWKQQCIRNWYRCTQERWVGNCYDCLRRCEGQQEWPAGMCHPPIEKR
jgi:hypothetical protein